MSALSARRRAMAPRGILPPQLVLSPHVTDNFGRANGTIDGSNGWTATTDGSMAISSNEAIGTTGVIKGDYRTGETYNNDQYAQCTVGTVNNVAASFVGLSLRNTSGGQGYALIYLASGSPNQVSIYKRTTSGSYTALAAQNLSGSTQLHGGDTLTFVVQGGNLTSYVNGAAWANAIDTSPLSGGAPGITSFHAVTLDNFVAGNAATGPIGAATVTDAFTRANNGLSVSQANWAIASGYPAVDIPIVSNQLVISTGSHAADLRTDSFNADHWSAIQMGATPLPPAGSAGFVGALVRMQGTGASGYLGCIFANGNDAFVVAQISYRIYRLTSGVSNFLAACATGEVGHTAQFDPTGTAYTFIAKGNRLSWRVNGVEVLATTDSTYTTGKPGVMCFPPSTADNWSAGNV